MPKYQLSIEIDLPENFGAFQALELKIVEISRESGRNLLGQILKDFETKFFEKKRAIQKQDQREKKFETLLGVIPLTRWRVFDVFKQKCVYPLDEWMGLGVRQKVSPGLHSEIIEQCAQRPYGQASKVCAKLSGVKRSVTGNWKLVQGFAKKEREKGEALILPDWKKQALPVLLPDRPDPCPILGVDPDATYVKPRRKTDTNHELKMAVLYTHRKSEGKKKNRWLLGQKQVILGSVRESASDLFNRVTDKAVKEYGLHGESRVLVHGDGDGWIKRFQEEYCPQAMNRLDPYHVFKKIREATGVEEMPKEWIKDFYTNPASLIWKLEEFRRQFYQKEDKEKMDGLLGYLRNNKEGMKPSGVSKQIKNQFPRMYRRGSGTIESNIFQSIYQRFKMPRMMWSKEGLNNLSFLRQNYLNKSFGFQKVTVPKENYRPMTYMDEIREVARDL